MMVNAPSASLMVWLGVALVVTDGMEGQHSAITSLNPDMPSDPDSMSPEVQPLATGGYGEVHGYVHMDPKSMRVMYLDVSECRAHCDSDAKCESFSYNKDRHDCLVSGSAIRYNPAFNYYSRMPWLHKKSVDHDDGEDFGATLGRYAVFSGMMYPARAAWKERRFISLDQCKDICDANPPAKVETNERLAETDTDYKYDSGDGCSAFSYSHSQQTCLLNGLPLTYAPKYNYYAKRDAEMKGTEFNKEGPNAQQVSAKMDLDLATQAANAKKEDQNDQKSNEVRENEATHDRATTVAAEQQSLEEAAKHMAAEAEEKNVEEQKAKEQMAEPQKPSPQEAKETKLKESTEKDLRKETLMEEQRNRDQEKRSKEGREKKRAKMDAVAARKLAAQAKEAAKQAQERRLKGNLIPMLNEFVDKAQLIANSERDLKHSMKASKEHTTKEALVKAKVRDARMQLAQQNKNEAEAEAGAKVQMDKTAASQDAALDSQKKAELTDAKSKYDAEKGKLDTSKTNLQADESAVSTLKEDIEGIKAQIQDKPNEATALQSKLTQLQGELSTKEAKVDATKSSMTAQETVVAEKQGAVDALKGESAQIENAEGKLNADAQAQKAVWKYTGSKPKAPTNEESELYLKFAKEVGLPVPGDGNNPIAPPAPPPEEDESLSLDGENFADMEKMDNIDTQDNSGAMGLEL